MADIVAKFSMIDEMSSYLADIASNGMAIVYNFESMEDSLNATFDSIENSASNLADSLGDFNIDVDTAGLEDLDSAIDNSISSAGELDTAITDFETEVDYTELEGLNGQLEDVAENADTAEDTVSDAMKGIYTVLTTLGVAELVKDIAEGLYEMTNSTSEARSTIAKATGATGDTLEGLMEAYWSVYGSTLVGDADSISATIGEVNTRLGYTGDLLEETTTLFLEFSQITGVDAVTAVQDVTKVMNLWGIEAEDMEETMDSLAYYGQVSGGSVSDLMTTLESGAAVFQNAGLSFEGAISLLAELELYGINSTAALTGFRTAINKITEEGGDAETELANIITQIAEMDSQSEATALAVDYFGSRVGQQLALAIRSGEISVETFTANLSAAEGTLSSTAETAQTLSEKWDQAGRSIEAAFGPALTPIIEGISSAFAGLVIDIGEFLQESPGAVAAITGIGVALGTVVVAFSGIALYKNVIEPMFATMAGTLSTAALPITAAAVAIGAITAAIMLLYDTSNDLNPDGTSFDEFQAEVDAACAKMDSVVEEYNNSIAELNAAELGDLALVDRVAELAEQESLSNAEMLEMQSLIQRLNSDIPGLGLTYDNLTGNVEDYTSALRAQIEAEYDRQRQQEQMESYSSLLIQKYRDEEDLATAQSYIDSIKEQYNYHESWTGAGMLTVNGMEVGVGSALDPTNLSTYLQDVERLTLKIEEADAQIQEIEESWSEEAPTITEGMSEIEQATALASEAMEDYKEQIEGLVTAYQEAYDAAMDSMEGQFGIFDVVNKSAEDAAAHSIQTMNEALQSQAEYWQNYAANIEFLKNVNPEDYGMSEEQWDNLVLYAQSGTEEAADLAASMVEDISNSNGEAVASTAQALEDVQTAQTEAAESIAEWQTNFDEQLSSIVDGMNESMDAVLTGMEISDQTYAAAENAIQQYANGILAMKGTVVDAATQVAQAAQQAISSISLSGSVTGHASGTMSADEDVFLAGEEGPELIVGHRGSTVFPTSETSKILNAMGSSGSGEKKIVLEIAGSGKLNIGSGTNKEQVVSVMQEYLAPVLMSLLQTEIYEEGDRSYEY